MNHLIPVDHQSESSIRMRPMHRQRMRRGLSIMEVLIAIGVLTIGLLGVASILPVATNNASMALSIDRAVEEINNRVASDLAELKGQFQSVVVANNSAAAFSGSNAAPLFPNDMRTKRVADISTSAFGAHLTRYDRVLPAGHAAQPNMPDAFCIDPWFLSAAGTLRDDTGTAPNDNRNGYDRTVFPCYDPRVSPANVSPTDPLSSSLTGGGGKLIDLPRFTRIGFSFNNTSLMAAITAEANARRSDDFSVNISDDSTLGAGLFVQRANNGNAGYSSLAKNTVSSKYSSIVTMSRSAFGSNLFDAAVVTMFERQVTISQSGTYDGHIIPPAGTVAAHNLRPYTAWIPDDPAFPNSFPTDENSIYDGEIIGYVSASPRPMTGGGGGEFEFRTSRYAKPSISKGDWLMLMRREYNRNPNTGLITPGVLKFAWYRITDLPQSPTPVGTLPGGFYETQVVVDGPDWVFHPTQVQLPGTTNQYGAPYYRPPPSATVAGPAPLAWASPPSFDVDNLPARGTNPTGYNHLDYGTMVVLMPNVVSVRQFQVQL